MSDQRQPVLFVSHGSPMTALNPGETGAAWADIGQKLERPKAILCVSAHWEATIPVVSGRVRQETIHDFYGFPPPLYALRYEPPGAPDLARRVAALTGARIDADRGLDHGAWVPAMFMFPDADIPMTQLTVLHGQSAAWHRQLGAALAPLRDEGVLILATGSLTHNLRALIRQDVGSPPLDYAQRFDSRVAKAVEGGDLAYLDQIEGDPDFVRNHPSPEHYLPLAVAIGAGGPRGTSIHSGFTHGALSMRAFRFDFGG